MPSVLLARIMEIFLSGDFFSDTELTGLIGFKNPKNIMKSLEYLRKKRYVSVHKKSDGIYVSLIRSRHVMESIYDNGNFKENRSHIRSLPWFIDEMIRECRNLPGNLPDEIAEMMKVSPSFFSILRRTGTADKIREDYEAFLFPVKMTGFNDPILSDYCLFHQIYLHCIYQDICGEGLAEGWTDILTRIESDMVKLHNDLTQVSRIHKSKK